MGVGKNKEQERMHGVDKMDTEENWKFGRMRDWVNDRRKGDDFD